MNKVEKTAGLFVFLGFGLLILFIGYQWLVKNTVNTSAIFGAFLLLTYLLNWINWGRAEGKKGDEMDEHIKLKSAKISYFILMLAAVIVLFISEGAAFGDIENYPLLIIVGLTFITSPIVEFFYIKKFKS